MNDYKLYAIRVFTNNWDAALRFYRDTIGFPLTYSDREIGWAQFQLGSAYLGLERCDPEDSESQDLVGRFVGVSIEVDDIHSVYNQLTESGVEFTSKPSQQPWGGTLAHFKDLDGNVLTLLG